MNPSINPFNSAYILVRIRVTRYRLCKDLKSARIGRLFIISKKTRLNTPPKFILVKILESVTNLKLERGTTLVNFMYQVFLQLCEKACLRQMQFC